MINISYCRFYNTKLAVDECLNEIYEGEHGLSVEEANSAIKMFNDILEHCLDNGIIENYNNIKISEMIYNLGK